MSLGDKFLWRLSQPNKVNIVIAQIHVRNVKINTEDTMYGLNNVKQQYPKFIDTTNPNAKVSINTPNTKAKTTSIAYSNYIKTVIRLGYIYINLLPKAYIKY